MILGYKARSIEATEPTKNTIGSWLSRDLGQMLETVVVYTRLVNGSS